MPIEVTDNYIRVRVELPNKFQEDTFRIIVISDKDKIKAVAGRLKGETKLTIQSFLFDKEKWTVATAKKWVTDHGHKIKSENPETDNTRAPPQAIDATAVYLRQGKSRYDDDVIYRSLPFSLEICADEPAEDGSLPIRGWASTKAIDMMNDIIEPTAYVSSLAEYMTRGTMLFMHDWWGIPIGRFDVGEIKKKGLWVEGRVLPTTQGQDVQLLIRHKVLDALSVGFKPNKWTIDDKTQIRTIHDLKLYEISVVNAGANPQALFQQAKSLNCKSLTPNSGGGGGTTQETGIMSNINAFDSDALKTLKEVEQKIGNFGTSVETVTKDVGSLNKKFDEQGQMFVALKEKQEQLAKGVVTPAEFREGTEKLGQDILGLKKEIQSIQQTRKVIDSRIEFTDWKLMPSSFIWVYDDMGRPKPDMYQKAFRLFHQPVNYKGYEGEVLKNLRNLHDTLVLLDAYYRAEPNNRGRYDITELKTWRLFTQLLDVVDPDFAKALSSSTSGSGADWVPTEMSAEMQELYRLRPMLEGFFPTWDMPSRSATWPIQTTQPALYRATEATVNNPSELVKSSYGTSKITFTAETFAVALAVSPEFLEDAIVQIAPVLSQELVFACADGYESLIVNGDDTATHMDTGASYTSLNPETYEKGLRKYASAASKTFDTQSATAGVGDGTTAFAAEDVRHARKLCGKMGKRPSEGVYLFSVAAWFRALNFTQLATAEKFGQRATWLLGDLETVDGANVYVSEHVREDLNASGVYTGSAAEHTEVIYFNRNGFRVGNRRGITVEFEKNILTQQWAFVASMRKSFQKMAASTLYPVALGYNVESA